jgi:anti-sigma B factor antagonist
MPKDWQWHSSSAGGIRPAAGTTGFMDIAVEELPAGITKIVLHGRLDTTWAVITELPFNKVATEKRRIIVDLSGATFLSSYGIRIFLVAAKIADSKGGKLVILCPEGNVAKVLKTAGTQSLIPVFPTEAAAAAALKS